MYITQLEREFRKYQADSSIVAELSEGAGGSIELTTNPDGIFLPEVYQLVVAPKNWDDEQQISFYLSQIEHAVKNCTKKHSKLYVIQRKAPSTTGLSSTDADLGVLYVPENTIFPGHLYQTTVEYEGGPDEVSIYWVEVRTAKTMLDNFAFSHGKLRCVEDKPGLLVHKSEDLHSALSWAKSIKKDRDLMSHPDNVHLHEFLGHRAGTLVPDYMGELFCHINPTMFIRLTTTSPWIETSERWLDGMEGPEALLSEWNAFKSIVRAGA